MAAAAATTTTKVLLTDLASSVNHVPSNYIRPISDRPNLFDVQPSDASIPHIDLQGLHGPDHSIDIKQIGQACQQDGFPESERMKSYSDEPTKTTRLSTSFNVKTEKVSNWRDFLRLHCCTLEEYVNEWPSNPPSFRCFIDMILEEAVRDVPFGIKYGVCVVEVFILMPEVMLSSQLIKRDCIEKALGKQGQHMALNYYPPCPKPELSYGLPGYTDSNLITILLQDDVPGLQVLRNGKWIAVNPIPNTFIVNIGDQMQSIDILHMQNTMRNSGTKDLQLNVVCVKALLQAEVKTQAQADKADDRAGDKVAGKRPVVELQ
ncbi:hypothetical protein SO802_014061 [Lithocarpus litseifolius]|uniref:Fe2OG dioxygenase domain-containing protein n=1 Tax=Lithocarpus litseifolius TaxID=425828 RepID=A0AAW2DB36_9ROSI